MLKCSMCAEEVQEGGVATQVFQRTGVVVTITGIPAISLCPSCDNAVVAWEVAQQVEELILPLFQGAESHMLPKPVVTITFPEAFAVAA